MRSFCALLKISRPFKANWVRGSRQAVVLLADVLLIEHNQKLIGLPNLPSPSNIILTQNSPLQKQLK
jgi:hypothetical protein